MIYTFISKAHLLQYFLGNYAMQTLAKLTLSSFLLFPIMINLQTLVDSHNFKLIFFAFNFIFAVTCTTICAAFMYLVVEAPITLLLKLMLHDCINRKKNTTNIQDVKP